MKMLVCSTSRTDPIRLLGLSVSKDVIFIGDFSLGGFCQARIVFGFLTYKTQPLSTWDGRGRPASGSSFVKILPTILVCSASGCVFCTMDTGAMTVLCLCGSASSSSTVAAAALEDVAAALEDAAAALDDVAAALEDAAISGALVIVRESPPAQSFSKSDKISLSLLQTMRLKQLGGMFSLQRTALLAVIKKRQPCCIAFGTLISIVISALNLYPGISPGPVIFLPKGETAEK